MQQEWLEASNTVFILLKSYIFISLLKKKERKKKKKKKDKAVATSLGCQKECLGK